MSDHDANSGDRIVVSVFACHPEMSSEAGIGWLILRNTAEVAVSRGMTVAAFMNGRSAYASSEALRELGLQHVVEVVGVDPPRGLKFLLSPRLTRLEYLVWNSQVRAIFAKAGSSTERAVLALHSTFASELLPTPISALPMGTFSVWGPVGSSGVPRVFLIEPREPGWMFDAVMQSIRNFVVSIAARWNARKIDLVFAQSVGLAMQLRAHGVSAEVFPNVVLPDHLVVDRVEIGRPGTRSHLRLLVAGHLQPRKRVGLAIAALTQPGLESAVLEIAGQVWPGVDDYLPRMAVDLGVADRVSFLGKLPRAELLARMGEADVLVHLSAREGASGTVGEATSVGLPVVCFAGTGAASVLERAGTSGAIVDPSTAGVLQVARAIVEASSKPRLGFDGWTEDRIKDRIRRLVDELEVD